ncbi:protein ROOT INITIATION DEFECTIVE 3-like [Durio zibethinus]|uniref:Protein ROOT INITIATION DEFECTIVE 3-like n=1 Tax=Durio zibethinus TaxID=66656 RepID=A0A6P5ZGW5_DURZI|nr:protein ROOT INITIATION DEFECTIVE 3-like [Durio zibethinus]
MSSSHPIVLTSSHDAPITAFDAASGDFISNFSGSRTPCHGLALVGNTFIAASHISPETASGSIHLYNWWSSTAMHNFLVPEPVASLAASPNGLYLFAAGLSGCIYALSVPSGDILRSYSAHNKPVSCLKISEDGSLLISGGDDGTIAFVPIFQIVEASPDESSSSLMMQRFVAHDDSVTAIVSCLVQCNSSIISCSMDCTVKFWRLLDRANLRTVTFPCEVMRVALDQMKTEFFAAGSDGFIYKGSVNVGSKKLVNQGREFVRLPQKHEGGIVSLVTMNEQNNLVSASEDGMVYIWEIETGQVIMGLGNDMGCISDMVVANGMEQGFKVGKRANNSCDGYGGLHRAKLSRSLKDTLDLEDVLRVATKDRRRAIDMLESAISMYERLLELILKEAKRGPGSNSKKEKHGM